VALFADDRRELDQSGYHGYAAVRTYIAADTIACVYGDKMTA
jgi:hypothetical protein